MPGTPFRPGQIRAIFDKALADGSVERAWNAASSLKEVELDRALGLTLALGRLGDRRYQKCARRFLARFITEAEPMLGQVKKVADALESLERTHDLPAMRQGAERALEDLGRQLRERR